jgi:hypothetical protein
MPTLVKIATTPAELDLLFRRRHDVYVDQGGYMPARPDGRIYDHFDAFPSTVNFVAFDGDTMVGGVRVMRDAGAGTHGDEYFDFGPHVPEGAVLGSGSMLWADRGHRGRAHLVPMLMNLSFYFMASQGVTHMVATVNPEVEDRFFRCGYQPIGEVLTREETGVRFRPCVLDLGRIASPIRAFIERQDAFTLLTSYNRVILAPGETLFRAGEPSDAVYVVVEGSVEAVAGDPIPLGPGQIVGELGVVLDRARSADVLSRDGALLVHVPREAFLEAVDARRDLTKTVLRTIAARLWTTASLS